MNFCALIRLKNPLVRSDVLVPHPHTQSNPILYAPSAYMDCICIYMHEHALLLSHHNIHINSNNYLYFDIEISLTLPLSSPKIKKNYYINRAMNT